MRMCSTITVFPEGSMCSGTRSVRWALPRGLLLAVCPSLTITLPSVSSGNGCLAQYALRFGQSFEPGLRPSGDHDKDRADRGLGPMTIRSALITTAISAEVNTAIPSAEFPSHRTEVAASAKTLVAPSVTARAWQVQARTLTARAMMSPRMTRETRDWMAMTILAQGARGMTSVGLNAVELVNPR